MYPLLILAVGIATVLGLILVLRVHAFLAMVVSAMIVSLLAQGSVAIKIQRVAEAFGTAAGNIAIVIALAAIIGECMLVSGAADRVVQMFLAILGEKRTPWALMGSGYVLAIPVFFDTVFYLLIPLARSLFKRTNRNYLLYIMAIAAGGAVTHTLVPPTPGPLVMASTLGVDVGVMILIGAFVAVPTSIAGLVFSSFLDRWMPVPFREDHIVGNADDDTSIPRKTPSLVMSLLPVVLPVLLISANTALSTLANHEHVSQLRVSDVRDWKFLLDASGNDGIELPAPTPASRVISLLPESTQKLLAQPAELTNEQQLQVIADLNRLLAQKSPSLYDQQTFDSILPKRWKIEKQRSQENLAPEEQARLERLLLLDELLQKDLSSSQVGDRERLNRLLLEAAFPDALTPHVWDTPLRKAADASALIGNPNLALLFSAIIAMYLVYQVKGTSLKELTEIVETSLMSGGTIILITAAGGAFGAMLKVAGIGEAIKSQFATSGAASGMMFLVLAYGIAALMKVAQGSSTVAMITVSGMLAAMISEVNLGYHPAYLATAIGAGSLMGSWMNDSGFWIFAKMGRLTETETLRSWTLLLVVLSLTSFGTTCLMAMFLPLV